MEVFIDVWKQNKTHLKKFKVNEAIYTFVAVNSSGKPTKVPNLVPETKLEKSRYNAALRRRQLSLVLAGKLSPKDATELKALFD
jgi:acyl-CoA hydrolase